MISGRDKAPSSPRISTSEDTEFTDSYSTRSYLEEEKQKNKPYSGYLNVSDSTSHLPMDEAIPQVSTTAEESFENTLKRQSIVGSYLFGTDLAAKDIESTVKAISSEKKSSPLSLQIPTRQSTGPPSSTSPRPPLPQRSSSAEAATKSPLEYEVSMAKLHAEEAEEREDQVIKLLCDYEDGFQLLLNRVKESMVSAKDASSFLKRRAQIETEYAHHMMKLGTFQKTNQFGEKGKGGSYESNWNEFGKMHHRLGELRLQFASSISEMADNIQVLYKNTERSRKQLKDGAARQHKELLDIEAGLEKARAKFESSSEDWERAQNPDAHISPFAKKSNNGQKENPFLMLKNRIQQEVKRPRSEEEARHKASSANENYKMWLQKANVARQQYFQNHLPRYVRLLKETNADCDDGLQKYLVKYAKCVESLVMVEATTLSPLDQTNEIGLLQRVEAIDNSQDFQGFLDHYSLSRKKPVNKTDHQYVPYKNNNNSPNVPPTPTTYSPKAQIANKYFGSSLVDLMESHPTQEPTPRLVANCIEYIEASGLGQEGLYRLSGSGTEIQQAKQALDKDPNFPLENIIKDVHAVTGVLKLFFRELSDPLFPRAVYKRLLEAARIEEPTSKLIHIHEIINELHDANYATLKYLILHLSKVAALEGENKMSPANLGIVWGPTLIDSGGIPDPNDLKHQSKIIEIVISKFDHIFETD
ncbi:hypothetical protein HDV06_002258 [Boothiomyces sp. JEL0866]|nr:hypothetical protein HDV06_002258 [Boothiomyces sp. JEL0866]